MTTFDQSDDWENEVFGHLPKIDTPGNNVYSLPVRKEPFTTVFNPQTHVPYVTEGGSEREPIEVFDEDMFRPRLSYYVNGRGWPVALYDDPLEEASFIRPEQVITGAKLKDRITPN